MVQIYEPIGILEGCGVSLQGQHDAESRKVRFPGFIFHWRVSYSQL